jgi:uncharacterized protein (TIGR00369 family)
MANAAPADPGFEARVRASFGRQRFMTTLGATLERVAPGEVEIRLPFRGDLTQQHGFLHAGAMTAAVDSACGYAALSLMPTGAAVLTVEFKVNLLAPGEGETFLARGRVVKPGRTLMVCTGDLVTSRAGVERSLVTMLATVMVVRERKGLVD